MYPSRVKDPYAADDALHGERLIAVVRLLLFLFRSVVMTTWLFSLPERPPSGPRTYLLPIYFALCVAAIALVRRMRPESRLLPALPYLGNVVDYGHVVAMTVLAHERDPANAREMVAVGVAIVLSFSVARVGAAQAIVSMLMACASYVIVIVAQGGETTHVATAFVLGSYIAASTLALRVVVDLQRRAKDAIRLGQYTLGRKIGEGGMGVVYEASHAMLRRPTAVKLLAAAKPGDASLRRFEREVRLTARLAHPNTIAIYDYGRTPDGVFYYAMEYLDGANLEDLVRAEGALPPGRVVHIVQQVLGSLAEAHGAGLIHRDIKPANVVLCDRGGVPDLAKVLDFGLVKSVDDAPRISERELDVTKENVITGTPLYLSPEAITSPEDVDARSDLYAVGALAYFLVTGTHLFSGRSVVEVCSHHLHKKPERPSARLGRDVPRDLEETILQMLEKDVAQRPTDARAARRRFEACACAADWTEAEARAWWQSWRKPAPAPQISSGVEKSMAVDVSRALRPDGASPSADP